MGAKLHRFQDWRKIFFKITQTNQTLRVLSCMTANQYTCRIVFKRQGHINSHQTLALCLACLPLYVKCFSLSWCCPLCGSFTLTSDNKAIWLENCFFRAILCKPLRWCCMRIPVDQQFVKHTDQPICHQQPCCVQSRWTEVPKCIFADIKRRQGQWAWSQCFCCYVIKFERLCRCPVCFQICCE